MRELLVIFFFVLSGVVFVVLGAKDSISTARDLPSNPFELKGSPYGEVLGMAMQDPVNLVWHGGQRHEDVLSADGGHGGESGFAINMNADGSEVLHVKLKMELGLFDKYTRQRNMPGGRKGAIRAYEKARVKNLLQTAYDFDRTNYGNYNALNFFYVTNAKRRDGLRSIDDAISLGRQTLEACEKYKSVDLQDALTAAVAAENILIWQDSLSRVRGGSLDELSKSHKRLVNGGWIPECLFTS